MQRLKIDQIESIVKKHGMDVNLIIFDFLQKFKIKNICDRLKIKKADGYAVIELLLVVLTIPLFLAKNINSFYNSEFSWLFKMSRSAVYRFLNSSFYDWRKLIYRICLKFSGAFLSESEKDLTAFIIDDTTLNKEGYKCEKVTTVYDHLTKSFCYGFKQVTLAYCDGKSIIPVDSSLHGEKELSAKKIVRQHSKVREASSLGAKRVREFFQDKITSALGMVNRAIKAGLKAKYALFDSWYASNDFVNSLVEKGLTVVCAIKTNRKCVYNCRETKISDLVSLFKNMRKPKRCARRNLKYFDAIIEIPGIGEVKICLCHKKGHKEWKAIISTDPTMTAKSIMKVYALRWSIEVFFKEAKGLLRMGKCQSVDFDAQISNISTSMILYIIITYYRRINDFDTTGTLFEAARKEMCKKTMGELLWDFFVEIFDYIFKELYNEGKTTIKRIKNTLVFKKIEEILFRKNFDSEIKSLSYKS